MMKLTLAFMLGVAIAFTADDAMLRYAGLSWSQLVERIPVHVPAGAIMPYPLGSTRVLAWCNNISDDPSYRCQFDGH